MAAKCTKERRCEQTTLAPVSSRVPRKTRSDGGERRELLHALMAVKGWASAYVANVMCVQAITLRGRWLGGFRAPRSNKKCKKWGSLIERLSLLITWPTSVRIICHLYAAEQLSLLRLGLERDYAPEVTFFKKKILVPLTVSQKRCCRFRRAVIHWR